MFKNQESPLSLFSFQDIITCLTGIMLFFLLLLSIKILEITKLLEQQSPYRAEIAEWQQRNELLRNQLDDVGKDIRSYRRRIVSSKHEDRATLAIDKFKLERESKALQDELRRLQEERRARIEAREKEDARQKELERRESELQKAQDKAEAIAKQNRAFEENIRRLREEIRRRKHSVSIAVAGNTDKTPIAVVCSKDRIRIVDLSRKKEISIPRNGPILSEMADEACRRLGDYPLQKYYFAFLCKPSAAGYFSYLLQVVGNAYKGIELGHEPILESEDCDL